MITPMEVLSDAVKIGLGALISAIVTFVTLRANRKKEWAQRKGELLYAASQQYASLDRAGLTRWKELHGWLVKATEPMSHTIRAKLESSDEISEAHKASTSVQATLLFLGEVKCNELFKEYVETLWALDKVDSMKLTTDLLDENNELLRKKRTKFFDELSNVFRKL